MMGKVLKTIYKNPVNGELIPDPTDLLQNNNGLKRNGKVEEDSHEIGVAKLSESIQKTIDEAEISALREELEKVAAEEDEEPETDSKAQNEKMKGSQPAIEIFHRFLDEKEALERFQPLRSMFEAMANLKSLQTDKVSGGFSSVEKILVPGGIITNTQTNMQTFQPIGFPVGVQNVVSSIIQDANQLRVEDEKIGEPAFVLLRAAAPGPPMGVAGVLDRFI